MTEFRDELNTMIRHTLAAITLGLTALTASAQGSPARPDHAYGKSVPIPDQYIVVFRDDTRDPRALAAQLAREQGGQVLFTYESAIKGFAARMSQQAAIALQRNPNVAYVEQNATVSLNATQTGATWGLDRVDQRNLPLNSIYNYSTSASNVSAFIIDTGILSSHSEFTGRMVAGFDAIKDGNGTNDCNGHGTHVAGTVGGSVYGVAKGVSLIPVRVLGCSGSGSNDGVIAGIDWVASSTRRPAVANMSLGGGASTAVNSAVAGAVAKGVTVVVAAGNSNANACNYSPASEPSAITVGSTTSTDARSSFSNFGSCLDIFAPGSSISSAWYTSNTATATLSGTSMASPHVAGAAALYLASNPNATPAQVTQALTNASTVGKVTGAGTGSPNRLLFAPAYALDVSKTGTAAASSTVVGLEGSNPVISCGSDCSETFPAATSVTLTATPAAGSTFAGWGGACSGSSTTACTVPVDSAKTVSATFNGPTLSVTLNKTVAGSRATGSVTSSPAGINCSLSSSVGSRTCSASFSANQLVTLTATPSSGSTFFGWSGCTPTSDARICTTTMDTTKSVTATFRR